MSVPMRCDVCKGSMVVKLPIREVRTQSFDDYQLQNGQRAAFAPKHDSEIIYREYPCPECGVTRGEVKATLLNSEFAIDQRVGMTADLEIKELKNIIAREFGEMLLKGDHIKFQVTESNFGPRLRGTIGIVANTKANTIEQRVAIEALKLLDGIVVEAAREIKKDGFDTVKKDNIKRYLAKVFENRIAQIKKRLSNL